MKKLLSMTVLLVGALGLCAAAERKPATARIWDIAGPATCETPGGAPQKARAGMVLPPGATIKTGADAALDLRIGKQGGLVRLTANTVVSLDRLMEDGGTNDYQLTVAEGKVVGKVKKQATGDKLEIRLPTGIVSVREGKYRAHSQGYIVLLSGELFFAHVPRPGEGSVHRLNAPPAVYFSPVEGIRPAPPELLREVEAQVEAQLSGRK